MDVSGTVAVITGGASGIGFGIASALAKRGARVVLADIEAARALRRRTPCGPRAWRRPAAISM
jgi:NAD(P)-dependent dehydrogenase (short-subunit alcohol dehydrogenase family)